MTETWVDSWTKTKSVKCFKMSLDNSAELGLHRKISSDFTKRSTIIVMAESLFMSLLIFSSLFSSLILCCHGHISVLKKKLNNFGTNLTMIEMGNLTNERHGIWLLQSIPKEDYHYQTINNTNIIGSMMVQSITSTMILLQKGRQLSLFGNWWRLEKKESSMPRLQVELEACLFRQEELEVLDRTHNQELECKAYIHNQ